MECAMVLEPSLLLAANAPIKVNGTSEKSMARYGINQFQELIVTVNNMSFQNL